MHVSVVLQEKGSDVVTAAPRTSIADVVALLDTNDIGAIVIVEDEVVTGLVDERDVVRALSTHGPPALGLAAEDLMRRDVHICDPETSVEHLMEVMTEHRVRHIPVEDAGRLQGVVSIGDVVKSRISKLEFEAESLHSYISNPF